MTCLLSTKRFFKVCRSVAQCRLRSERQVFPSARLLIEAELRGWLPVMGVELDEAQMQRVLEAAELRLLPWVEPGGQLGSAMSAHIVTAQPR